MSTIFTCLTVTPTSSSSSSSSSSLFFSNPRSVSITSTLFTNPSKFNLSPNPLFRRLPKRFNSNSRVLVRATVDIGAGGGGIPRPGGVIESDKLSSDVRKRTMEAVDGCGGRVTIGDVASRAGLNLNQAQKALQAIAADTHGFLEVSGEGDILYVFPKDYRLKLNTKSFRIKAEPFLEKTKAAIEYLIRVSFGTALIASIVIVYTTIIALLTSSRSEEDNRGRRGGRSYDSGFNFYFNPLDLFWYWDPYYYRRRRTQTNDEKFNFIESVFSFVFGDGDPNQGIEEERWKLVIIED